MASITIRNLDEGVKQALRERAARNGRSMEEEVRHLLGAADALPVQGDPPSSEAVKTGPTQQLPSDRNPLLDGCKVLLIISGGIDLSSGSMIAFGGSICCMIIFDTIVQQPCN